MPRRRQGATMVRRPGHHKHGPQLRFFLGEQGPTWYFRCLPHWEGECAGIWAGKCAESAAQAGATTVHRSPRNIRSPRGDQRTGRAGEIPTLGRRCQCTTQTATPTPPTNPKPRKLQQNSTIAGTQSNPLSKIIADTSAHLPPTHPLHDQQLTPGSYPSPPRPSALTPPIATHPLHDQLH